MTHQSDNTAFVSQRPALAARNFSSPAVEETIQTVKQQIADPELAWLFENCCPNTLDTTVFFSEEDGKPDTYVITGDIDAMWLRDSTAQVWPYLPLMPHDAQLARLIAGVIHRQTRCIQLDPYANAFFKNESQHTEWERDFTTMKPGLHERKWEIDSLCYPIRLAFGYWQTTGDATPFDDDWENAMEIVIRTFREQQRKENLGPYEFKRGGARPAPGAPELYGAPVKPNGLICSRFRPSDDETTYQFLIPSNFFAVISLRQMAILLNELRDNANLARQASALADEVESALQQHATHEHPEFGTIYAYEIDGRGGVLLMDDANVPSLLSLPYLGAVAADDAIYQNTRRFVWSEANPWYFAGKYAGIGGPHLGPEMIWPMSLIMSGLTSDNEAEIRARLETLRATHAGTGFMHETFHIDDASHFTRSWFAWANTLFGEFVIQTAARAPQVLATKF